MEKVLDKNGKIDYERLVYRRQYILSPVKINHEGLFSYFKIDNDYHLLYHIDLPFTSVFNKDEKICLLGDIMDPLNPDYKNSDILNFLIKKSNSIEVEICKYSGRFVLLYKNEEEIKIFHDPSATRKVFYSIDKKQFWISSQPHLIAIQRNLKKTTDNEVLNYYSSKEFTKHENAGIYDYTSYSEIKQLMPNHFLSTKYLKPVRYWPNRKIQQFQMQEVIPECAKIIKGSILSISNRYKIMLPVTSGIDSRCLLAASMDQSNNIYYYINLTHGMTRKHPDIRIPSKLFQKLKMNFYVEEIDENISDEDSLFKKIYFQNNEYASKKYMHVIYNYLIKFSDYINLPGAFIPVAKNNFYYPSERIDGNVLAKLNYLEKFRFVGDLYSKWLNEAYRISQDYNINILDLFYWEERVGNWRTQIQIDKDIAQEEICPYNSRTLVELMLGVNKNYRMKPNYRLFIELIRFMNAQALKMPINPSLKKHLFTFINNLHLFKITRYFH